MPQLRNPGGIVHFGGAAVFTMRSADGWIYTVFVGERSGKKFGTHCYRTSADNTRSEWVDLGEFTEGRAGVTVEADGVYLSWPINRERDVTRVKLPGFILPGYPTSGQSSPAPAPIPTQPVPTPTPDMIDEVARAYTSDTKKLLLGEISKLQQRVAALEARPVGGFDERRVNDHAWAKAGERLYAELADPNSPISNLVRELATGRR